MTKLNRNLILILVVQVAILLGFYLVPSGPKEEKPKKVFPGLAVDEIQSLQIAESKDKSCRLEKRGKDTWVLSSGGDYPVKADKVKEVLAKLPGLEAGQPVADKEAYHHKLEVAAGNYQRKLTLSLKGGKVYTFYLGSSPVLRRVHLRFEGKKEVVLAGELSAWDFSAGASNWVDTEYFKVDKDKVLSFSVQNEHGTLGFEKGADGKWALSAATAASVPADQKLKETEIDSILSSSSAIALQEPISTKLEPTFELDKPKATLTVVAKLPEEKKDDKKDGKPADPTAPKDSPAGEAKPAEGAAAAAKASSEAPKTQPPKTQTYVLTIGAKKGDSYYAKASTSSYVVQIGAWSGDALANKKLADLLEKKEEKKDEKKDPASKK